MQIQSKVTSQWKQPLATQEFTTGVSLHSHTSVSEETLGFIHAMFVVMPGLKRVFDFYADCSARYGVTLDYARANWRPPLQPKMAYDLESRQIQRLGLNSLVSITDHDTIEAPMLLRTVPSSRHIPVSVEWSAPFGQTIFHLGFITFRAAMAWSGCGGLRSTRRLPMRIRALPRWMRGCSACCGSCMRARRC